MSWASLDMSSQVVRLVIRPDQYWFVISRRVFQDTQKPTHRERKTNKNTHTHLHKQINTHPHAHTRTHTHVHTHTNTHTPNTHAHSQIETYKHTHANTLKSSKTHKHTQTHTNTNNQKHPQTPQIYTNRWWIQLSLVFGLFSCNIGAVVAFFCRLGTWKWDTV